MKTIREYIGHNHTLTLFDDTRNKKLKAEAVSLFIETSNFLSKHPNLSFNKFNILYPKKGNKLYVEFSTVNITTVDMFEVFFERYFKKDAVLKYLSPITFNEVFAKNKAIRMGKGAKGVFIIDILNIAPIAK